MSDDCGCCATPPTGTAVENRPGLSAVVYRSGTFATFKQAIVQELARARGLETLTSRGSDDYTITTIELWSAVADVLAFYQERIANEAFLQTALVRDSMLRLVRLIGYELAPGVSAQTWLSFTVERGATATVPPRTRVKSIPLAGEPPVTFETMDVLEADATWNALEPFRLRRHVVKKGDTAAELDGVTTALMPGDVLVFIGNKKAKAPKSTAWDVVRVRTVQQDPQRRRTRVTWSPPAGSRPGRTFPSRAHVFVLRQRAGVFGHNAPDWHMISDAGKAQLLGLPAPEDVTNEDRQEWPQFNIYAPVDPNKARERRASGTLTVQPTVESVVAAALAAARSAKEAVLGEAATAAAVLAAALGNMAAAASEAANELTEAASSQGSNQAGKAVADVAALQGAIAAIKAHLTQLQSDATLGNLGIKLLIPVAGPQLFIDDIVRDATRLKRDTNDLSRLYDAAKKDVDDLLATFQLLGTQGTSNPPPSNSLATKFQAAVDAAAAAVQAARNSAERALWPAGAIAGERMVQEAMRIVVEDRNLLAAPVLPPLVKMPERAALVAIVAAEFAVFALDPARTAATVTTTPPFESAWQLATSATTATALGVAFVAAVTVVLVGLPVTVVGAAGITEIVTRVIASAGLFPVIFSAISGAVMFGSKARPGAQRVADEVRKAVVAALAPKHPAAPERYLNRLLLHNRIDLDTVYPRIVNGSWVLLSSPLRDELYHVGEVQQTSRTDYSLTGAVTRLKLEGNSLEHDADGHNPYFNVRETAVFGQSEELQLALDTVTRPFSGTTIDVSGRPAAVAPGRTLLIAGTDTATWQPASDLVSLIAITSGRSDGTATEHTILTFTPGVTRHYALDGLLVHGNVTYATNGETVRSEIVGDGDAAQPFQKFPLRKKPVTFAPDRLTGVVTSSLTLLVNGVKWSDVPTFYGASPADPVYTSRIADDTTLTVGFGDGITGLRLPAGRQNVVAHYRQGIGAGGNVAAGRLTTLLDRPAGLRAASNPIVASGGVDPESLASARIAAPGTVRTFGRAVSLRDFEDSTLFNGIVAKASATWVWTGERRAIHLTVAAAGGRILPDDAKNRLRAKLNGERDTNHRLLIDNYARVPILIDATLTVDSRHVASEVLAAARAALLATLAFEARRFGEPVYVSDVFTVLQHVDGVVFVDVNTLDLKSRDAVFRQAHGVDDALGQPQPQVLILPARPDLVLGMVRPAELAVVDADGDLTLRTTGGLAP